MTADRSLAAGGQVLLVLAHAGTDAALTWLHTCAKSLDVSPASSAGLTWLLFWTGGFIRLSRNDG